MSSRRNNKCHLEKFHPVKACYINDHPRCHVPSRPLIVFHFHLGVRYWNQHIDINDTAHGVWLWLRSANLSHAHCLITISTGYKYMAQPWSPASSFNLRGLYSFNDFFCSEWRQNTTTMQSEAIKMHHWWVWYNLNTTSTNLHSRKNLNLSSKSVHP